MAQLYKYILQHEKTVGGAQNRITNEGLYIIAWCALGEEANSLSSDRQVIFVSQSSERLVEQLLCDRLKTKSEGSSGVDKNGQCRIF